jgi:cyclopropane fatty-acyl-phospholipid synthase-like methyltransferase
MNWLAKYYNHRARQSDRQDFLRQVGHTERGRSISDAQFQAMLASLRTRLDLRPDDVLLDLCCGNGVFTQPLARDVQHAVGVDFSEELIAVAEKHHGGADLDYQVQNVKQLDGARLRGNVFNKILMNAALQHFGPSELEPLLKSILSCATRDRVFLFSFVPDFDKRAAFRRTLHPSFALRWRRLVGHDLLGHWWKREEAAEVGRRLGLEVEFFEVDPALDGSRYRFDIRMS